MKIFQTILLSCLLMLSGGCVNNKSNSLAANEEDYGIGGTGIVAENNGLGGTGIIGQITGFGSIFVNGIEVEHGNKTVISINGRQVEQHDFQVGEVVEILTLDSRPHTGALQINIRHEVAGPVSFIDHDKSQLTILNQSIITEDIPANIRRGDFMAVSGFRNSSGEIHATRITPSKPGEIILRGTVQQKQDKFQIHGIDIAMEESLLTAEKNLALRGTMQQGQVNITHILPNQTPLFHKVSKWIIQGFPASYKSTWNNSTGLNNISGQTKPVIFEVINAADQTTSVEQLYSEDLAKGSAFISKSQPFSPNFSSPIQRGGRINSGQGRKH